MGGGALLRSVSARTLSFAGLAGLRGELITAAPTEAPTGSGQALLRLEGRGLKNSEGGIRMLNDKDGTS